MDAFEKIQNFPSLKHLCDEIKRDSDDENPILNRYGVRFILLNNFDLFQELAGYLAELGISTLNLETLISKNHRDTWITGDMIHDAISHCQKSTLITPLSEIIRFYNDSELEGFLNEIILLEDLDKPKRRLYIPIIGLHNRFIKFLNSFGRIYESAPIWSCDAKNQSVQVYLLSPSVKLPKTLCQCSINDFHGWLRFWKVDAPQDKVLCFSKAISIYSKNAKDDNIFSFTHMSNSYEILTKFLEIDIPIPYVENEEEYWNILLNKLDPTGFNFDALIKNHFNKVKISEADILSEWVNERYNSFDRWLLKQIFLRYDNDHRGNQYLDLCLDECTEYENTRNIFIKIAERIFYEITPDSNMAKERARIMIDNKNLFNKYVHEATQMFMRERIIETAEQEENGIEKAINLCTGIFTFEKSLFIDWYIQYNQSQFSFNRLQNLYPLLAAYLSEKNVTESVSESWIFDYLREYKLSKLTDKYQLGLRSLIEGKNKDANAFYGWYHFIESSKEVLAKCEKNSLLLPKKIYWIDGLGMEYLSLIISVIEKIQSNYKIIYSNITRSDLPSSTAFNRFTDKRVVKIDDLDKIGHSIYQNKQTLITQIDLISNLIKRIISENIEDNTTIAIVSDHGSSALSRLFESKRYKDKTIEHDGRYIRISSGDAEHSPPDYIVHDNETGDGKFKVALGHASLGRKPIHEVHGGCTPEEVLVPLIIISNRSSKRTEFVISSECEPIPISRPTVSVGIMPQPEEVILEFDGKDYIMARKGAIWSVNIENPKEGTFKALVKPSGGEPLHIAIEFYGLGFGDLLI